MAGSIFDGIKFESTFNHAEKSIRYRIKAVLKEAEWKESV
jgi:hypothetical protein